MNLLLIVEKVWRHKAVTLPVIGLVLVGLIYVIAIKPPVYEASGNYILVNPPEPPTAEEIAADPSLARVNADNPYTRYSDQSVVAQVLAKRLDSDETRAQLQQRGADPGYAVEPSAEFGFTAPVLQITGTGPTAQAAITTANVVGDGVERELARIQEVQDVDKAYWITTQQVVAPHEASLKATGKLRMLVVVVALGAIVLFVAVSIADALSLLRRSGRQPPEGQRAAVNGDSKDGHPHDGRSDSASKLVIPGVRRATFGSAPRNRA